MTNTNTTDDLRGALKAGRDAADLDADAFRAEMRFTGAGSISDFKDVPEDGHGWWDQDGFDNEDVQDAFLAGYAERSREIAAA